MNRTLRLSVPLALTLLALAAGGCAALGGTRHGQSTSLVDYIDPSGQGRNFEPTIPHLRLPLTVGVAFVPSANPHYGTTDDSFTEQEKVEFSERVVERFERLEFVDRIEVIPAVYLRSKGGFTNLDQLRNLYGIDVIALMSYDQVQFTTQDALALTYWTIVGAYIVPAEKNDTHTLIDTAVFDIESRKMLFRAPGTSLVKGRAAPIDLQGKLKRDSVQGFEEAGEDLIANLDVALADLQQRVEDRPDDYEISSRPGYSGDAGALLAALTAGAALAARLASTRERA